jgi:hypothetical protein
MPREQRMVLVMFGGSLIVGLVVMIMSVFVQAIGATDPVRSFIEHTLVYAY